MSDDKQSKYTHVKASRSELEALKNDPSLTVIMAFRLNESEPFGVTYFRNDEVSSPQRLDALAA